MSMSVPGGPQGDSREILGNQEPKNSQNETLKETTIFKQSTTEAPHGNSERIQAQQVLGTEDVVEIYKKALNLLQDPKIADAIDAHLDSGGTWKDLAPSLLKVPEFTSKYSHKCLQEVALRAYFKHLTDQVFYPGSREPLPIEEGLERAKSFKQEFHEAFKDNQEEFEQRMTKAILEVNQTLSKGEIDQKQVALVLSDKRVTDSMQEHIKGGGSWKDMHSKLQTLFKSYQPEILKEAILQAYFMDIAENIDPMKVASKRPEFEEIFPEVKGEFEQRAKVAIAKIVAKSPPPNMPDFIYNIVMTHLEPYLEGKITPQNEPQPYFPIFEHIKKQVALQFGETSVDKIQDTAIYFYVLIVLSHHESMLGRELYNDLFEINTSPSLTSRQIEMNEKYRLYEFNQIKEEKLNNKRYLSLDEKNLTEQIYQGIKKDFPGQEFDLKKVQKYIKEVWAILIAKTPQAINKDIKR